MIWMNSIKYNTKICLTISVFGNMTRYDFDKYTKGVIEKKNAISVRKKTYFDSRDGWNFHKSYERSLYLIAFPAASSLKTSNAGTIAVPI